MAKLFNQTKNLILCSKLETANSTWARIKGLLGRKSMDADEALWIPSCNSIHTFFMNFPIDVAFVDKHLTVTKIIPNLRPGRLAFATLRTRDVFEFPSGSLSDEKLAIGDQLHVDH